MKKKTLLIVGGSGFFGQSIIKYFNNNKNLYQKFYKIIIVSRKQFKKNSYYLQLKKKIKVIKINSNILTIKNLPHADYIIYAAILNNYNDDNRAVKNFIRIAKNIYLKRKILYISSGAVYGIQPKFISNFKEDYLNSNKIINFKNGYKKKYSVCKILNEKLFQELSKCGAKVSIARCFSFVGEHLPRNSVYVVGNFIDSIVNRKNLVVNANYKIFRSYMHEDDLANWLLKILERSNKNCNIYNVGSDNIVSVQKLSVILAKKYHLNSIIKKIKNKKMFDKYIPNINKAKKILNLNIKYNSIEAILKTIDSIIKNNEKTN